MPPFLWRQLGALKGKHLGSSDLFQGSRSRLPSNQGDLLHRRFSSLLFLKFLDLPLNLLAAFGEALAEQRRILPRSQSR